jgi:hypothetical protein
MIQAPESGTGMMSPARALTFQGLVAECCSLCVGAGRQATLVEQELVLAGLMEGGGHPVSAGLISNLLQIEREGNEARAPEWMRDMVLAFRDALGERGLATWWMSVGQILRDLNGPGESILARHLRDQVGLIRLDGFTSFDPARVDLIRSLANHVRVELRLPTGPERWENELIHRTVAELGSVECLAVDAGPPTEPRQAPVSNIVVPQVFQEHQWVATKVREILSVSEVFPEIAVVVPPGGHARTMRLALEALNIPVSCQAESAPVLDTRPGRFVVRLLALGEKTRLEDLDALVNDPWARESFEGFWLWPFLQRLCGPIKFGQTAGDWERRFIRVIRNWVRSLVNDGDGEHESLAGVDVADLVGRAVGPTPADNPGAGIGDEGSGIDPVEIPVIAEGLQDKLEILCRLAGSIVRFLRMAEGIRPTADGESVSARHLADALGCLLDSIGFSRRLAGFRRGRIPAGALETDQRAAMVIRDTLYGLSLAGTGLLGEPAGTILLLLSTAKVNLPPRDRGCVQVLTPRVAASGTFDHVFLIGMEGGSYEASLPDPLRVSEDELKRQKDELAFHIRRAVYSARQGVWLVRGDNHQDKKSVPSALLRLFPQPVGGERLEQVRGFHHRPADSFSPEKTAEWADRLASLAHPGSPAGPTLENPSWYADLMAFAWPEERPFSPTTLQNHLVCPFRHFARETLGCRGFEADDAPRIEGNFLHKIMEIAVGDSGVFPPPGEAIKKAAEEAWPEFSDLLDPSFRSLGEEIAATLEEDKEIQAERWLAPNADGRKSVELRVEIPGKDSNDRPFIMRMRMDTLLEHPDAGNMRHLVVDYKRTIPGKHFQQIREGTTLEPVTYVAAAGKITGAGTENTGMAFLQLKRGAKSKLVWLHRDGRWESPDGMEPISQSEQQEQIEQAVAEVRRGRFSLTMHDPHDHPAKPCGEFCQARHVCRHANQPAKFSRS